MIITDTIVWSFIKARLTIILLTVHMYLPAIPILMQIDNNTCDSVTRDNIKSRLDGHGRTKDLNGQMLDKSFGKIFPPDGHGRTKLCKFEVWTGHGQKQNFVGRDWTPNLCPCRLLMSATRPTYHYTDDSRVTQTLFNGLC